MCSHRGASRAGRRSTLRGRQGGSSHLPTISRKGLAHVCRTDWWCGCPHRILLGREGDAFCLLILFYSSGHWDSQSIPLKFYSSTGGPWGHLGWPPRSQGLKKVVPQQGGADPHPCPHFPPLGQGPEGWGEARSRLRWSRGRGVTSPASRRLQGEGGHWASRAPQGECKVHARGGAKAQVQAGVGAGSGS